ncbi:MAG: bifunctional (p)ppGpp synthetase/guanosine-3',5'-bis(diphosphate) 3'-pyrophosphohydrolase [Alphaproteobacteria bacterium]|nr:bifunctional (p)ppGpp synthetase/guanosine-3',5'-bis(diphosphate) 3'-pyrophosphohydrolase [Alphaproteobacteria bacterium]
MRADEEFISQLYKALRFATDHHGAVLQVRKSTNIPYIIHPVGVMQILLEFTDDVEIIQAGILHDILEDTNGNEEDVEKNFGTRVKNLVVGASEPEHDTLDWEQRKEHTINYVQNEADLSTLLVICADKLHNFSTIIDDYNKLGPNVWQKFNRGKDKQRWYYEKMSEAILSRDKNNPLFQKFYNTVHDFFKALD